MDLCQNQSGIFSKALSPPLIVTVSVNTANPFTNYNDILSGKILAADNV